MLFKVRMWQIDVHMHKIWSIINWPFTVAPREELYQLFEQAFIDIDCIDTVSK